VNRSEFLDSASPKLAELIDDWGLPKEKRFPLPTAGFVKMAAENFPSELDNMTPSQRLTCARNICHRGHELKVSGIESTLPYKYAGSHLSPFFSSFINMRKEATAHLHDEDLNKFLEVAKIFDSKSDVNERVMNLDKLATALEDFDRVHGLDDHWGTKLPDPAYSTFGLTVSPDESVSVVVKIAGHSVSKEDFDNADWSRLDGRMAQGIVDGLKCAEDSLAVFDSLPTPEKEFIYQALFHSGE